MQLKISLVLETEKEETALRLVGRLNQLIQAGTPDLEKYHKGGTKVFLKRGLPEIDWPNAFLMGLNLAQTFGRSWTISGSAEEELNLVSTEFSVAGINFAEILLLR